MTLIPINLYGKPVNVNENEPGLKEEDIPEPIKAAMIGRFGELPRHMIALHQVPGRFALLVVGNRYEGLYGITFERKIRIIDKKVTQTPMLSYTKYEVERTVRAPNTWFVWEIESDYIGPFNDVRDFFQKVSGK